MRITNIIVICVLMVLSFKGVGAETSQNQRSDGEKGGHKCGAYFKGIEQGMTRAEIDRLLSRDGGLQSYVIVRYINPECPNLKIAVEYNVKRNPSEQTRIVPSPDDKAVRVSQPYIENPNLD